MARAKTCPKCQASMVEGFVLESETDIERWENVLRTANICRDLNYQEIERWLA